MSEPLFDGEETKTMAERRRELRRYRPPAYSERACLRSFFRGRLGNRQAASGSPQGALGNHAQDLGSGPRTANQESLDLVAAERAHPIILVLGLHPLHAYRHAKRRAQADDRADECKRLGILGEFAHERAIDLDLVE